MLKLLITAAVVVIITLISAARRKEAEKQRKRQPLATPRIKLPWEFEQTAEISTSKKTVKVQMSAERSGKADQEFQTMVDESIASDEEAFKEETVAKTRSSKAENKPSVPLRREPVRIAGFQLTPRTIREGIILSEILRRPEF